MTRSPGDVRVVEERTRDGRRVVSIGDSQPVEEVVLKVRGPLGEWRASDPPGARVGVRLLRPHAHVPLHVLPERRVGVPPCKLLRIVGDVRCELRRVGREYETGLSRAARADVEAADEIAEIGPRASDAVEDVGIDSGIRTALRPRSRPRYRLQPGRSRPQACRRAASLPSRTSH